MCSPAVMPGCFLGCGFSVLTVLAKDAKVKRREPQRQILGERTLRVLTRPKCTNSYVYMRCSYL